MTPTGSRRLFADGNRIGSGHPGRRGEPTHDGEDLVVMQGAVALFGRPEDFRDQGLGGLVAVPLEPGHHVGLAGHVAYFDDLLLTHHARRHPGVDAICEPVITLFLGFQKKQYDPIARFHNIYGPLGTYTGGKEKAPAKSYVQITGYSGRSVLQTAFISVPFSSTVAE